MRRWMMENPRKGVMGVVTTAVGIGMCAKYGADAASQLISVSTEFLARRATKALAEMLKQEEEERQLLNLDLIQRHKDR